MKGTQGGRALMCLSAVFSVILTFCSRATLLRNPRYGLLCPHTAKRLIAKHIAKARRATHYILINYGFCSRLAASIHQKRRQQIS